MFQKINKFLGVNQSKMVVKKYSMICSQITIQKSCLEKTDKLVDGKASWSVNFSAYLGTKCILGTKYRKMTAQT